MIARKELIKRAQEMSTTDLLKLFQTEVKAEMEKYKVDASVEINLQNQKMLLVTLLAQHNYDISTFQLESPQPEAIEAIEAIEVSDEPTELDEVHYQCLSTGDIIVSKVDKPESIHDSITVVPLSKTDKDIQEVLNARK